MSNVKLSRYICKKGQGAWKRFIREVNFVGEKECQCIAIEHPSRLYVTDDYIVTHNTLSHILLACDIQTVGRFVFGMVYDKKEARTKFAATQFRPIMDYWLDAMKVLDGIEFDRDKDTVNASRKQLDGVNSIFSFASTADASLREGKSAVSSELAGWSGDWLLEEERSQWPLGAVDVAYRRLDNSAIATKPVRSWGTPGSGLGVEKEVKAAEYHFYPHGQCEECSKFFL